MKAVILSAKFAPGHFSHMLAYYYLFSELGIKPVFYLDKKYKSFLNDYPNLQKKFIDNKHDLYTDILFIYNMSTIDNMIINAIKKRNSNVKIYFVFHEPWYGLKNWLVDYLSGNESLIDSIKVLARYIFVIPVLKKTDMILLPSKKAKALYERNCKKCNNCYTFFPLIFSDETNGQIVTNEKKYFSFISTVQKAKNFDMFLEYVKFKSKTDKETLFQIATRTDISEYLDEELQKLIQDNRLIVNHGHNLSNSEINHAYAISNCTWMLYKRSTQSGALCKAMMFGSPVIASDIGSFRETVNKDNGIILTDGYSFEDIDKAHKLFVSNIEFYSKNARETFMKKFFYLNQIDTFIKLIK